MPLRELALLLLLAALWGSSFVLIRIAVPELGAVGLAWTRVSVAALALALVVVLRGGLAGVRTHWRGHLVLGVFNSALPFALFSFAELTISASTAAILNATSPFFGAALGPALGQGPLRRVELAGMGLGFAGVVSLVGWHEALTAATTLAMAGCLLAAFCYAVAGAYARRAMAGVPSLSIACGSQLAAALTLAPVLPLTLPPAWPSPGAVGAVVALGLFCTAFAYLIYFHLIARLGAARALTVTFLIPLFGVVWAYLFLGEAITAGTIAACASS